MVHLGLRPPSAPTQFPVLQLQICWGNEILDHVCVDRPGPITCEGRRGDLKVDLPGADAFILAYHQGLVAQVVVPESAQVTFSRRGQTAAAKVIACQDTPFAAQKYALEPGERLVYRLGGLTAIATWLSGAAPLTSSVSVDWAFQRTLMISALLHLFFVVAAQVTPKSHFDPGEFWQKAPRIQVILKEKDEPKVSQGKMRPRGKAGAVGDPARPKRDTAPAAAPKTSAQKWAHDRQKALNSGLLALLRDAGGAAETVFRGGGLGNGLNIAMGGLQGATLGAAGGAGGLATRGTGTGGGGESLNIGGIGWGDGPRGRGYGDIQLDGGGNKKPRLLPGKTIVNGALGREDISRVIRQNLARFKFCYEKELNAEPDLTGKVVVHFTIAPNGAVAQANVRESSMPSAAVEGCVTQVMRTLKFPEPKGGGIVVVTYPFVFNAA